MRVDLAAFEQRYAGATDPWGFADDHYEQRKYAITVASLPWRWYRHCFEPGCSIGALTERLADVAEEVIALEVSPTAADRARDRLLGNGQVEVRTGSLPEAWPDGEFDLIVFSELGYYWDAVDLAGIAQRLRETLEPGGHLAAVHWLGESSDHLLGGHEVHNVLGRVFGTPLVHHDDIGFVLDVWST